MAEIFETDPSLYVCTICGVNRPIFQYQWGDVQDFRLCQDCAKMVSSNVTKDILKKDPSFITIFDDYVNKK